MNSAFDRLGDGEIPLGVLALGSVVFASVIYLFFRDAMALLEMVGRITSVFLKPGN